MCGGVFGGGEGAAAVTSRSRDGRTRPACYKRAPPPCHRAPAPPRPAPRARCAAPGRSGATDARAASIGGGGRKKRGPGGREREATPQTKHISANQSRAPDPDPPNLAWPGGGLRHRLKKLTITAAAALGWPKSSVVAEQRGRLPISGS